MKSDYIWYNDRVNQDDYRWLNLLGKQRLSLFLAVIDRLIGLGINLDEYRFIGLDYKSSYREITYGELWYKNIIELIPENGFTRIDGQTISKESITDLISFETLDEFLSSVIKLTTIDHLHAYNKQSMMSPTKIVPFTIERRFFDIESDTVFDDIYDAAYPEEAKVNVIECCQLYQTKLCDMAKETDYKLLIRKLDNLRKDVTAANQKPDFDWSTLKEKIQSIYDDITALPLHVQKGLLDSLEALIKNGKIDIEIKKPQTVEGRVAVLETQVLAHEKQLHSLEKRVSNVEEALLSVFEYIDNGTPIPKDVIEFITKKNIIQVMAHKTNNKSSTLRKMLLLGALTLGSLPLLVSSNVKLDITEPTFDEPPAISTPVDVTNPIVDYPIDNRPTSPQESSLILKEEEPISLYTPIVSGQKSYYRSIYDKNPLGTTKQEGLIIRYYILENGQCVKMLDTKKELKEFLKDQRENVQNFTWKAAVCVLDKSSIEQYIEVGLPVPAKYTTFFIDYSPSLEIDFEYNDPKI